MAEEKSITDYRSVRTVCPYCGVGCGLFLEVVGNKIVDVRPDPEHPVSLGSLCVKGWNAADFVQAEDRLTVPLLREGDGFREASWDEALDETVRRFRAAVEAHGGGSVAVMASAKLTNEENFLLSKFARAALKTNNIDHCARL